MFVVFDGTVSAWDRRGRDPAHDMALTQQMLRRCGADNTFAFLRVSQGHRSVAFGSSDLVRAGADAAIRRANAAGFPAIRRLVGGNAVVFDEGSLRVELGVPAADPRTGMRDRFAFMTDLIATAVRSLGVDVVAGEPAHSYCPGEFSLMTRTPSRPTDVETASSAHSTRSGIPDPIPLAAGKVVGVAQRIVKGAVLISATITAERRESSVDLLTEVYDALGLVFSPTSVGQIGIDPGLVTRAIKATAAQRMRLVPWEPDPMLIARADETAGRFALGRPVSEEDPHP